MGAFEDIGDAILADGNFARSAAFVINGSPSTVPVVFALGFEGVQLGGDVLPDGAVGHVGVKSSAVPGIQRARDRVTVDGVEYAVLKVHPDESGWLTIFVGRYRG